nr:Fe-S-binding domain-containing protein [Candidatus Dadabacteria bacterium]NIQ14617.1 Fe-S-binding domain-containing protein [Candidatus Dadabacteria bacterium]
MEYSTNILSLLIFFPLIGIVLLTFLHFIDGINDKILKFTTFIITLAEFLLSIPIFFKFNTSSSDIQFEQILPWLPDLGISYHLGLDGISLFLVLLTTFIFPIAILS